MKLFFAPVSDNFVGEKALRILRIVAAGGRAFDCLGHGGLVRLAHLQRHHVGELVLVAL